MLQWSLANLLAWAVQVTAIVGAGLLLPLLLKVRLPGARLVFLRVLLVACLLLPLLQPWVAMPATVAAPLEVVPSALVPVPASAAIDSATSALATRPPASPAPFRSWPWPSIVIGVILAGAVWRVGWLGLGLLSLARLRHTSVALEPPPEAVEDAARVVGAKASFRVSPRVPRPVTFGLRRPVVLVPAGFLSFAPAEQSAIACHELIHVKRLDWLRTLAEEAVCAVLWFHPAIWWLVDEIRLSAEQVIDRQVVRLLGDRRSYLNALLRLASSGPEPMLQPATLFLKHGHLRQRVAMLIKETPMSRIRLAASFAVVLTVLACGGWLVVQAFPLRADQVAGPSVPASVLGAGEFAEAALAVVPQTQGGSAVVQAAAGKQPERILLVEGQVISRPGGQGGVVGSGPVRGVPLDEAALVQRVKSAPIDPSGYFALAKFYEDAGRVLQAEEALIQARRIAPNSPAVYLQLASFYNRQQLFDKTMEALKQRVAVNPTNPESHYIVATYYWDKAFRDRTLTNQQAADYVAKGMDAIDEALRLKPQYMEALTYKSLLLRQQAGLEPDPAKQKALADSANEFVEQAKRLKPPQPAWDQIPANAVRIGGAVKPPTKVKDVKPVYPPVAQTARVQGVVILETVVGETGTVTSARVLRSIPLLDQAALDAVRQWEFTPTLLNGAPVPVVMTLTVNFTLDPKGSGVGVGGGGGFGAGVGGGVASDPSMVPPPPPPPPPAPAPLPPGTVRVGGNIRPPTKVVDVKPVYPPDAKDARVQGVVIVEATISTDGKVTDARVLRSIPQLDQAALDAVKQWEFTPTIVDGIAMKVIMTVTVNFTLQ